MKGHTDTAGTNKPSSKDYCFTAKADHQAAESQHLRKHCVDQIALHGTEQRRIDTDSDNAHVHPDNTCDYHLGKKTSGSTDVTYSVQPLVRVSSVPNEVMQVGKNR